MKPKWQNLANLAQEICTLWFQFFGAVFASKGYPFKNIFDILRHSVSITGNYGDILVLFLCNLYWRTLKTQHFDNSFNICLKKEGRTIIWSVY